MPIKMSRGNPTGEISGETRFPRLLLSVNYRATPSPPRLCDLRYLCTHQNPAHISPASGGVAEWRVSSAKVSCD